MVDDRHADLAGEGPVKRSVTVAGHRTSLSLEPEFWQALRDIAWRDGRTLSDLIAEIDGRRGRRNLSSAVRVFVLERALAEHAEHAERPPR